MSALEAELAQWKQKYADLEEELQEFQEMSSQLEAELEANLKEANAKRSALERRVVELEAGASASGAPEPAGSAKGGAGGAGGASELMALQAQLRDAKSARETAQARVRELETVNDELERRVRESEATAASARSDADRALEDYALAQTDFEQRRDADQVALQRLRDELRDTQTELRVLRDARPAAGENGIAIDVSAQHNGVGGKPAQLLAAQEMLATIRHLRKMLLEP